MLQNNNDADTKRCKLVFEIKVIRTSKNNYKNLSIPTCGKQIIIPNSSSFKKIYKIYLLLLTFKLLSL